VSSYDDRPPGSSMNDPHGRYGYRDADPDGLVDNQPDTAVLQRDRDYGEPVAEPWRLGWNSGADLGLLIMRVVLGGIFAAHGAQKVFGWWNGPGLDGFADNVGDLGFNQTDVLAAVIGFTELVGGVLVVLGLFTPLAAAGLLAVAINAVWIKWGNGLFLADDGFEAELALAGLAAGLTLTGPGRIALDNGRVWFRHPVVTGFFFLLLGVAAALVGRILFRGSL
jgi:putative oxidoreductase